MIDGKPVCGDRNVMAGLEGDLELDPIVVSQHKKAAAIGVDETYPPFSTIVSSLFEAMGVLAPLVEDAPGDLPGYARNLP